MSTARLLSIQTGVVAPLFVREDGDDQPTRVISAIRKQIVSSLDDPQPRTINRLGVQGDEQADATVHGGIDKALYAYPSEHYAFWQDALQRMAPQAAILKAGLPWGSMGENLTLSGLLETDLCLGDTLTIGDCQCVVTAPRQPCYKFNAVMGWRGAAKAMLQSGHSGWYLRVVQTGTLHAGQAIRVQRGSGETPLAAKQAQQARQSPLF